LVMDDDPLVRSVAAAMLAELGYRVALATDGAEAVTLFRQATAEGRRFSLVILDLTVPGGMGGRQALPHLLALDPQARVVVSSGYSSDPILAEPRRHGFAAVVLKPYDLAELGRVLDRVLGNGAWQKSA
ncbi:MAG: response regulator, partial [Thermodesulfobacteriota bacterium]